ncbi:hypothetical protein SUGI_0684820 [Cryptomeria japonica]|nr:hypothetical protein SUGI_0684820 [Cryptomeria japonica]
MTTGGLHIAIFSKIYVESPWCLAELCFMLETHTPILPVFYHDQFDDLRWVGRRKGCYAPAFSRQKKKGSDEGMLLKSIVNSVLRVMKKEPFEVAKHPVGLDEIVRDFEKFRQEYRESE